MAKQPGVEGPRSSLTVSLLCGHALLDDNLPASTVGSRRQRIQGETLLEVVRDGVTTETVADRLAQLTEQVKVWVPLAPSGQHMGGRDLGRQEPTPTLRYRALNACAG